VTLTLPPSFHLLRDSFLSLPPLSLFYLSLSFLFPILGWIVEKILRKRQRRKRGGADALLVLLLLLLFSPSPPPSPLLLPFAFHPFLPRLLSPGFFSLIIEIFSLFSIGSSRL